MHIVLLKVCKMELRYFSIIEIKRCYLFRISEKIFHKYSTRPLFLYSLLKNKFVDKKETRIVKHFLNIQSNN